MAFFVNTLVFIRCLLAVAVIFGPMHARSHKYMKHFNIFLWGPCPHSYTEVIYCFECLYGQRGTFTWLSKLFFKFHLMHGWYTYAGAHPFEFQSVKVKHMLWPHSVAASLGGGTKSAIDPDLKRNRMPAGSIPQGQCQAIVWTHIHLSQETLHSLCTMHCSLKENMRTLLMTAHIIFEYALRVYYMTHKTVTVWSMIEHCAFRSGLRWQEGLILLWLDKNLASPEILLLMNKKNSLIFLVVSWVLAS